MLLVWEPPAAPPGAPELEEAELEEEEGGKGGLDLVLKPAESKLISRGQIHYITQDVCVCACGVCVYLLTFQPLDELQLRARRLSRLFFYGALQLLQHFLYRSGTELHRGVFSPQSHPNKL